MTHLFFVGAGQESLIGEKNQKLLFFLFFAFPAFFFFRDWKSFKSIIGCLGRVKKKDSLFILDFEWVWIIFTCVFTLFYLVTNFRSHISKLFINDVRLMSPSGHLNY